MGRGVVQDGDLRVLGHAGETFDFRAAMSLVPERGLGLVLLMNADTAPGRGRLTGIADGVFDLLVGREPPAPGSNPGALVLYGGLLAVAAVQVAGMARSVVALRRWRAHPERRPRGRRALARHVGLPLVADLVWAAAALMAAPAALGGSLALMTLQVPDLGYAVVASGAIALVWAGLRTALGVLALRAARPPGAAGGAPLPSAAPKRRRTPLVPAGGPVHDGGR